jgi:hypothetical protein
MTREELLNNISFKTIAREMKKKYPFITYVRPGEEFENDLETYDTFYTIEFVVDTEKFLEMYPNFSIPKYYYKRIKEDGSISSPLWHVLDFDESSDFSPYDLHQEINETLSNITERIKSIDAIPDEYKLDRILYGNRYILS